MKQEEIISLLGEAIRVLETIGERKLNRMERSMFRNIWSLCLDPKKRESLLGDRSMDFYLRAGCACAEVFRNQAMSDTMMALIDEESLQADCRRLSVFFRRLRQSLSMEELHSADEFLRLANLGLYTEPFAYLGL